MARTTLRDPSQGIQDVLGDDIDTVLRERFFAPAFVEEVDRPGPRRAVPEAKPRPEHYKVICISLYTEDLDRLDAAVRDLKRKGHTKASRSSVLRAAMMQLDLAKVPRGI